VLAWAKYGGTVGATRPAITWGPVVWIGLGVSRFRSGPSSSDRHARPDSLGIGVMRSWMARRLLERKLRAGSQKRGSTSASRAPSAGPVVRENVDRPATGESPRDGELAALLCVTGTRTGNDRCLHAARQRRSMRREGAGTDGERGGGPNWKAGRARRRRGANSTDDASSFHGRRRRSTFVPPPAMAASNDCAEGRLLLACPALRSSPAAGAAVSRGRPPA